MMTNTSRTNNQSAPLASIQNHQDPIITGPLGGLPDASLLRIFSILPSIRDVTSLGLTCRKMHQLSKDEGLWEFLYHTPSSYTKVGNAPRPSGGYLKLCKDNISFERNTIRDEEHIKQVHLNLAILRKLSAGFRSLAAMMNVNLLAIGNAEVFNLENEDLKSVAEQLHPDVKRRLEEYSCQLRGFSPSSKEVIVHVQIEVCVVALLLEFRDENWDKVHDILDELKAIDPRRHALSSLSKEVINHMLAEVYVAALLLDIQGENWGEVHKSLDELKAMDPGYMAKLYELLWIECGKPDLPTQNKVAYPIQKEISEDVTEVLGGKDLDEMGTDHSIWGERAFYDLPGYNARTERKIGAVLKFKAGLKNGRPY